MVLYWDYHTQSLSRNGVINMTDFSKIIDRHGTDSLKWDATCEAVFGQNLPADFLSMWIADMDLAAPEAVVKALAKRLEHPVFGYTAFSDETKQACVDYVQRHFGWTIERDWIVFSPGIVPALALAVLAYTQPGEDVLIFSPVYGPFFQVVKQNKRNLVDVPLREKAPGDYEIDFALLEKTLKERQVKLCLFCSPHNPVGRAWTDDELLRVGKLLLDHGVKIVSDEIHADFCYNAPHKCLPSLAPELAKASLCCLSPSKSYNIAGIGQSAIVIPDPTMRQAFAEQVNAVHISGHVFAYTAMRAAWTDCDAWFKDLLEFLRGNRDYLLSELATIPGLRAHCPEATFLLWLDCRELMPKLGLKTQTELNRFFVERCHLGLNPGTDFGENGTGFLRLNFGCPRAYLEDAIGRLRRAVEAAL